MRTTWPHSLRSLPNRIFTVRRWPCYKARTVAPAVRTSTCCTSRLVSKQTSYPSQHDFFFGWAWDHRQKASLGGGDIHYAPAEYVIVWKAAYHAEGGGDKHVRDLLRMIELSGDQIDREILIGELQRRNLLEHFRTMVPGFV
jgi:hypothetical protein